MNVVDSSAWLEYLCDTGADLFAEAIEKSAELVVPSICLYEVGKKSPVSSAKTLRHKSMR
ncbi:MAG: hypothetical protein LBK76_08215 [Verrucomicrobiales bacterium]|jgi:predicted nucleic acid-binding protein|nr:hypothetical protein [Verrucomicrobiales bacterium]